MSATLRLNQPHWQLKRHKNRKAQEATKKILQPNIQYNNYKTLRKPKRLKRRTADTDRQAHSKFIAFIDDFFLEINPQQEQQQKKLKK